MFKLAVALAAMLFLAPPAGAIPAAQSAAQAKAMIEQLGSEALTTIQSGDRAELTRTFADLLNKNFDMSYIGAFSLGNAWRTTPEGKRAEYLEIFRKMVVSVYVNRFSDYSGQQFTVASADVAQERDSYRDLVVHMTIDQPSGPPVKVDWRVRDRDGEQRIIDVIVEGVSMSVTQRSEFASIIDRNGGSIDALIETLNTRVAEQQAAR